MAKSSTHKITLFEPDEDALNKALVGRDTSPGLNAFLKNLLKRKKWTRKINIPSGYNDVAAVLVFTTTLKEAGLEILSELHVYFGGGSMVEKWEVAGEMERIRLLPKEAFRAIDISKVRVDGAVVNVEFTVPLPGGQSGVHVKAFDFSAQGPEDRTVSHPLLGVD
jgi:hypothetical protein